jgi:hypothetical protein
MKFQFTVNGSVGLALIPENDLEKSLLKSLSTQNNTFKEVSKSASLGAMFNDGTVIISQESASKTQDM